MPANNPMAELQGLTTAEAAERLRREGPNILPAPEGPPWYRELAAQMVHFFAIMLWIAGILAFISGTPPLGVAIFTVVVVNGLFAFIQEYRAERATRRLRALLPLRAVVIRDGRRVSLPAEELVRGDLVVLDSGLKVPADIQVVTATGLQLDTSTLTGESVPETLSPGDIAPAGTFVVGGEGLGVVVATGAHTRLASVSLLTERARRPQSPLHRELNHVVRTIAVIAVSIGAIFWLLALFTGQSRSDAFLFAVGVVVALVPEGLLPTVTLSLAMGAQRMARRRAVVRHLEAVETLGTTSFICTDKTGTLTRNEMNVVVAWTPSGAARIHGEGYAPVADVEAPESALEALRTLAAAAVASSDGRVVRTGDGEWRPEGDPMEAAIHAFALRVGARLDTSRPLVRFPFDRRRRRMSVVKDGWIYVKGAPESVLAICRDGGEARAEVERLAREGYRLLAVARRPAPPQPPSSADEAERDLELLGILALEDPPRQEVRKAIADCRTAGIRVAMITGDHPGTAGAIAREVGLLVPGARIIQGSDLPPDDEQLGALIDQDGMVVSRVSPEDKLRIARALRSRGHVVAMTGDGVNDAPALREADVGVAMGKGGTDVAREAADLVLLDDNFLTIVAAVEEGRATFTNIRRFLTYHLTDNVAELTPFVIWSLSRGRVPLALGILQILALDIGTDMLPALALGSEPPRPGVLARPFRRRRLVDRRILLRVFGVLGPTEAVVEMVAFLTAMAVAGGWRPGNAFPGGSVLLSASGAAFTAVFFGQLGNAFACRSESRPPWALGWFTNRMLVGAVAVGLVLLFLLLFVPPIAGVLGHKPPPAEAWAVAALATPAVLLADAVHKKILAIRRSGRQEPLAAATQSRTTNAARQS